MQAIFWVLVREQSCRFVRQSTVPPDLTLRPPSDYRLLFEPSRGQSPINMEPGLLRTDHIQPVLHINQLPWTAADLAGALSDILDKAGDQVALQLDRQFGATVTDEAIFR